MAGDPLYEPLGLDRRTLGSAPRPRRWPLWLGALGVAALLAGVASLSEARRDRGSDPAVAVAAIDPAPTGSTQPAAPPPAAASPPPSAAKVISLEPQAPDAGGSAVEMQNGVKIVRFSPAASSASITIPVGGDAGAALAPAPDPRLVEKTADGPLPRIGADGRRPAEVYGRSAPVVAGPRLAVLLTGMGLDQVATAGAARQLPPEMSFAFTPGTADAGAQVAEVRRAGHEVFLDLTPAQDAVSGGAAGSEVTLLHRNMARFVGYAGVLLGVGSPETTRRDLAGRGLQGLVEAPGSASGGTAPSVDAVIEGASAVAGSLDRLVALAQREGGAIAVVHDGQAAQGTLASLAASLAARGVTLVPVTGLAADRSRKAASGQATASDGSKTPNAR